jgi:hypothetical protein
MLFDGEPDSDPEEHEDDDPDAALRSKVLHSQSALTALHSMKGKGPRARPARKKTDVEVRCLSFVL